jgi:hypothetical protein
MGFVYLLLSINDYGEEVYKIGVTKRNVDTRIRELQTGNPNKISVLRIYDSDNYLKVERWMHRKYFDSKTEAKNEWRNLTNEQIISFLEDCKSADETITILKKTNPFYK